MNNRIRYRLFDIPLSERNLCFFDLETTRLDLKAEIIEIGAIRVEPKEFRILNELELKIKPEKISEADPEGLAISGYSDGDWMEAVALEDGVKTFLEFAEGTVLVANNLPFDWMWLQKAVEDLNLQPTYFFKGLDIFSLAWLKFKAEPHTEPLAANLSLKQLATYFNVDMGKHHRALDDARTAYNIFLKLTE
ncbi:MAG: 3'-5' exonuclease [Candidatus Colwellbacteria bacterium]|nr:3'-5' exonuclease [Candidatus Colwellbacteria bacterium]